MTCNPVLIPAASCNDEATHVVECHRPYAVMKVCRAHASHFVQYTNVDRPPANVWALEDWEAAP